MHRGTLRTFLQDCSGNTAITAAIALPALMAAVAVAIEMSQVNTYQSKLQAVADVQLLIAPHNAVGTAGPRRAPAGPVVRLHLRAERAKALGQTLRERGRLGELSDALTHHIRGP